MTKIYLQKPWKWSDSPHYKSLTEHPPDGISYLNGKDFNLITKQSHVKFYSKFKKVVRKSLKGFTSLPNARAINNTLETEYADLIHCCHCMSKDNKPWVMDLEFINQLWLNGEIGKKDKVLKILMNENCKAIMPWTNWCRDELIKRFPEIKDKVQVVYPAIPNGNFDRLYDLPLVNILYSSRFFNSKGGELAVEVMDKLTKKYENVNGTIVSNVPLEVKKKYQDNKQLTFKGLMSKMELEDEYKLSDIFLYPSRADTFGFQILEAMSFGLPVIACDFGARKELINGKNGLIVEEQDLLGVTEALVKDKKRRIAMSKAAEKTIIDKFSIDRRNKVLE